ncbi:hypothetical protein HNP48_001535 [Acidovorax soli]|uniref:Uncharacterized protein n=1 Tax=Acidovorax soli TaxID=592050 RepID=A0A7X0U888_9BURK|nr:hypothetical protein [Acidovorax soli]MBB6558871.1 hypothetical protein [Acidovorax soli]
MTDYNTTIHPLGRAAGAVFTFSRLYETHGPFTLNGHRLDQLVNVHLLLDSSTSVTTSATHATTTSDASGVLGRAVVGGIVGGGTGALIGATTGGKTTKATSSAVETRSTDLTVKLEFHDGYALHAIISDQRAYHWLLAFVEQEPASEADLEEQRQQAETLRERTILEARAHELMPMRPLSSMGPGPVILGVGCVLAVAVLAVPISLGVAIGIWLAVMVVLTPLVTVLVQRSNAEDLAQAKSKYDAKIERLIASFDENGNPPPGAVDRIRNGSGLEQ